LLHQIVDDFSSLIGDAAEGQEGIDANHTKMCKFHSRDDPGYKKVLGVIKSFVEDSNKLVKSITDQCLQEGKLQCSLKNREALNNTELNKLPTVVQRKIQWDMRYNKLGYSETVKKATLKIPVFQEQVFHKETSDFRL
jgi:hypothetical protein